MAIITLEVSDELADALSHIGDRLPEWLTLSLQQPPVPASVYRDLLHFLASSPTPHEIAAFQPDPKVQQRLHLLLQRERDAGLTPSEKAELDEYERIEHLVVMLKAGNLQWLRKAS